MVNLVLDLLQLGYKIKRRGKMFGIPQREC
jgi:hypothetical protein